MSEKYSSSITVLSRNISHLLTAVMSTCKSMHCSYGSKQLAYRKEATSKMHKGYTKINLLLWNVEGMKNAMALADTEDIEGSDNNNNGDIPHRGI